MSEAEFRTKRRQKFLTEKYFKLNRVYCEDEVVQNQLAIDEERFAPNDSAYAGVVGSSFKNTLKLFHLHYTAGAPIESLRPLYHDALKWLGEWHVADDVYVQAIAKKRGEDLRADGTPFYFEDLHHYQLAMDMISIGILLGEADAVRRIAAWITQYRHTDLLFESLIKLVIADPDDDTTEFFHEQPYDPLIDAFYTADTPEQAGAFVKTYLEGWYKSFEGVPWHDGHLVVTEEYSNYEGYWAFEAAAVCVLHNIDDSSFRDHIVYPKDLADWAREHKVVDTLAPPAGAKAMALRCDGGQPCPQAGFWFTTAKAESRQRFKAGQTMPVIAKASWGATVWYWHQDQS